MTPRRGRHRLLGKLRGTRRFMTSALPSYGSSNATPSTHMRGHPATAFRIGGNGSRCIRRFRRRCLVVSCEFSLLSNPADVDQLAFYQQPLDGSPGAGLQRSCADSDNSLESTPQSDLLLGWLGCAALESLVRENLNFQYSCCYPCPLRGGGVLSELLLTLKSYERYPYQAFYSLGIQYFHHPPKPSS